MDRQSGGAPLMALSATQIVDDVGRRKGPTACPSFTRTAEGVIHFSINEIDRLFKKSKLLTQKILLRTKCSWCNYRDCPSKFTRADSLIVTEPIQSSSRKCPEGRFAQVTRRYRTLVKTD